MVNLETLKSIVKAVSRLGAKSNLRAGMCLIGNGKTGKSLEGHRCPMMKKAADGHLVAPCCPSCYSVACLNNHPSTRAYLEREDQAADEIVMNAAEMGHRLSGYPVYPGQRLRVYGLTDFQPSHLPMLKALSEVYQLDIISKTLWMGPHYLLKAVAELPGVNVSLSFNKEIPNYKERMRECMQYVRQNNLTAVSFNYTFTSNYRKEGRSNIEEYRRIPGIRVFHTTQMSKEPLAEAIGHTGCCGILDENGKRIPDTSKAKGSCRNCNFCRLKTETAF